MNTYSSQEYTDAKEALLIMMEKSECAQIKFKEKTAQHTLLKHRIHALHACVTLMDHRDCDTLITYTQEELDNILPPILSLLSKSQKAITKLKESSWQYQMLKRNIHALQIAQHCLHNQMKKEGNI